MAQVVPTTEPEMEPAPDMMQSGMAMQPGMMMAQPGMMTPEQMQQQQQMMMMQQQQMMMMQQPQQMMMMQQPQQMMMMQQPQQMVQQQDEGAPEEEPAAEEASRQCTERQKKLGCGVVEKKEELRSYYRARDANTASAITTAANPAAALAV